LREEKRKVISAPKIIFEDKFLLILEKPADVVVNRAETVKEETLQDWVEEGWKTENRKRKTDSNFARRSGIVHRLDKETSGLLIVAKTPTAFENLQRQFKERRVEKRYLALVHGKVTPSKGEIAVPISRHPYARKKFGVFLGGRPARTKYRAISNFQFPISNEKFTLLELRPETGRTHQIRVHLKYIGHPVVADAKYAGRKTARADRKWCPRQFLHASYLSFIHPTTGKKVEFSSKLPSDLKRALSKQ